MVGFDKSPPTFCIFDLNKKQEQTYNFTNASSILTSPIKLLHEE